MFRMCLYLIVLFDLAVIAAKNLAVKNVHLDPVARQNLDSFNLVSVAILILAALILLFLTIFRRKPPKTGWPQSPPD